MARATHDAMHTPVLAVADLHVHYGHGRTLVRAVDGVSLTVAPGETVGLVGESGSGKSTIGRAVVGLAPVHDGTIRFNGDDITHASRARRRELSAHLQMVFQDPYSSLNPARTIAQTLEEPLLVHASEGPSARRARVREMLDAVELPPDAADRYPAQFSGGQRQRIAIARALMLSPRLVVCDEPVSALDLSIQAQVLNLLADLRTRLHAAYLFIAHDLAVVKHLSHRTVVLYKGRVMEEGPAGELHAQPLHPYTRALVEAAPLPDPRLQRARALARLERADAAAAATGDPRRAGAHRPPAGHAHSHINDGCPFAGRCELVVDRCRAERPPLVELGGGRRAACFMIAAPAAPAAPGGTTPVPPTAAPHPHPPPPRRTRDQ